MNEYSKQREGQVQRPCGRSELGMLAWSGKKPVWLGWGELRRWRVELKEA